MDELFENWSEAKAALLTGLDATKQDIVGQVMENQKQFIMENAVPGSTQAHDIAGFRKILMPMIRRVIPGSIATEIVAVQPMGGPVDLVYSMRYRYAETMPDIAGGVNPDLGAITAGDELFGNATPLRRFYSGDTDNAAGQVPGASGLGHENADPGNIDGNPTGQAWQSTFDASTGCTIGGSGSKIEGSAGRKVSLEVVSQSVEAGTRKLQSGWTIEAMQDLKNQHGMDMKAEMTKAMSAEIVQEIDDEIITDLLGLAGTVATYDFDAFGFGNAAPDGYTPAYIGDRLANLAHYMNWVGNEIGRKTRRGQANWAVVPPVIVSALQSAAGSVFAPAVSGSFKGPNNTELSGTMNGRIKVYNYLWNQAQPNGTDVIEVLMGYKGGDSESDAGYFYCPYIPIMTSGVTIHPVTTQPVISLMTRYGKAVFTDTATSLGNSADYYGKVVVTNLAWV